MQELTEEHIDKNNPGKIINVGLLKQFDKYIRTDDASD